MPRLMINRLILFLLVIFLAKPFWNWFKSFNYEIWRTISKGIDFFEANPLITFLVIIILFLLLAKRN